ncbi:MAG TPA: threonine/serine exporter family protein [Candidatus Dorea intestinavium]|nr:threonine/serine exporter family protein [Candidatus Dorea intestinavium]
MNIIHDLFLNVVCPVVGTVAFAALFNVPHKYYATCGLAGLGGWLMYSFTYQFTTIAMASFFGAMVVVLISRMLTVKMKCPITVFLVSGIFPLIPGAKIYNTAFGLFNNRLSSAAESGFEALKIAFAIVLGIVFIVAIPREWFRVEYWKRRRPKKSKIGEHKHE